MAFCLKASIIVVLLTVLSAFLVTHYRIGIDDQKVPCLGHHVYFIDLKRVEAKPVKGEAYSFVIRLRPLAGKDKRSQEFTGLKGWLLSKVTRLKLPKTESFL